jgi:hypothetical protein
MSTCDQQTHQPDRIVRTRDQTEALLPSEFWFGTLNQRGCIPIIIPRSGLASMRKISLPIVLLTLALGYAFPALLHAGEPVINSVQVDFAAHTIAIAGADFGNAPPTVTLGATLLAVTAHSPTAIQATLPSGLAAGSYRLLVAAATTPPGIALLDVTVGTAGAQGPPGPSGDVSALTNQFTALQTAVSALQSQVASLQKQLNDANSALALAPFVLVDRNPQDGVAGPHITFKGANIHIVSGSGATDDHGASIGLGNLIIGYDEPPPALGGTDRHGSHNLVIGRYHRFTYDAFGGFVAGEANTISAPEASVLGGESNTAAVTQSIRPQPPFIP